MPFAGYSDFDACTSANSDKRDPSAYCAAIKRQAEGKFEDPDEPVHIEDFKLNEAELFGLSEKTEEWVMQDGMWINQKSGHVVYTSAAADGGALLKADVPDDARNISSRDEATDDERVVEGPRGGLYAVSSGGSSEISDKISQIKDEASDELLARREMSDMISEETDLDECSFTGLDIDQAEKAATELARLSDEGRLENVDTFQTRVNDSILDRYDIDEKPAGLYDSLDDSVQIQSDNFVENFQEVLNENNEDRDMKPLAGDDETHMIRHEVSHSVDLNFNEFTQTKANSDWSDLDVDDETRRDIATEFSMCAALSPSELAAETLAFKLAGDEDNIPDVVQDIYAAYVDEFGGESL